MHVFAEAERVHQFHNECNSDDDAHKVLTRLGALMNESYESSAKLYECSCSELDELVRRCRENGAVGARLTGESNISRPKQFCVHLPGAGWGGCAVALVDADRATQFEVEMRKHYERVFVGRPADGISVNEC